MSSPSPIYPPMLNSGNLSPRNGLVPKPATDPSPSSIPSAPPASYGSDTLRANRDLNSNAKSKPAKITINYGNGHEKSFYLVVKKLNAQGEEEQIKQICQQNLTSFYMGKAFEYGLSALHYQHGLELKDIDFKQVKLVRKAAEKLPGEDKASKRLYLVYIDEKSPDDNGQAKTYEVEIIKDLELSDQDRSLVKKMKPIKTKDTNPKLENINTALKCFQAAMNTLDSQLVIFSQDNVITGIGGNYSINLAHLPKNLSNDSREYYTKLGEKISQKKSNDEKTEESDKSDEIKDVNDSNDTDEKKDKEIDSQDPSNNVSNLKSDSYNPLDENESEHMKKPLDPTEKEMKIIKQDQKIENSENERCFPNLFLASHNDAKKEFLLNGTLYDSAQTYISSNSDNTKIKRTSQVKFSEEEAKKLFKRICENNNNEILFSKNNSTVLKINNKEQIFLKRMILLISMWKSATNTNLLSENHNDSPQFETFIKGQIDALKELLGEQAAISINADIKNYIQKQAKNLLKEIAKDDSLKN